MGLSFNGGSSKSTQNQSSSGNQANVYSSQQGGVQSMLGQLFQSLIPSLTTGTLSPVTAASTTANADQINKNFASEGTTLQQQLASRGFADSGLSGQTALQTELARQSAQAGNLSAGASSQIQQNQSSLLDALNYAFTSLGSSGTSSSAGTSSGSNFGWGASGAAAFGIPA